MHQESGSKLAINKKITMTSQFLTWRHRQFFLTLFCFSCRANLLVQVSRQYHCYVRSYDNFLLQGIHSKSGNPKYPRLSFFKYLETGERKRYQIWQVFLRLNVTKCWKRQGYRFYCFWIIKGKPTGRGWW